MKYPSLSLLNDGRLNLNLLKQCFKTTPIFMISLFILLLTGSVSAASRVGQINPANSIIGSNANDYVGFEGVELPSGNVVIVSSEWNGRRGAVTCLTPEEYKAGGIVVSAANSLVGSTPNDSVGSSGIVVLTNGNYVVLSPFWHNGAAPSAGAVTWVNGSTCIPAGSATRGAVVSASNSLVGSTASDFVGIVTPLSNGNYVVRSLNWDNGAQIDAGAVTWVNGSTGVVGVVSAANSLVGSKAYDQVGYSVTVLPSGNYVVISSNWDNGTAVDAGAVTWGNGTTGGPVGVINASNSLVSSTANSYVGGWGIRILTNGHYVVSSPSWSSGAASSLGAVTWGNGTTGRVGEISAANSLVGTTANDRIGTGVLALSNGNYVVGSPGWDNGAQANVGAVTWGNGTTGGTVGPVSAANSLVGTTANDEIGDSLWVLSNGHYVTRSRGWDNGAQANVGAVTWGNGNGGTVGPVSAANSLVGSTYNDQIGGAVTLLPNGNYVVGSPMWDNGAQANVGAVTWGNGNGGTVGPVSAANSLVGSTYNDQVGTDLWVLANGNYVVRSPMWDNGAAMNAGAVTWGNGNGGTVGTISAANSLVGSSSNDAIGENLLILPNGHYVVRSVNWDNGAVSNAGAVTWGNGNGGTVGAVSAANSLVGSTANEWVGSTVYTLSNGNYVVRSPSWGNGAVSNAGAVTWGNGNGGTVGTISAANSLVGSTAGDQIGSSIVPLTNGNYVVVSTAWDNGAIVNAGAATWGNGNGGTVGAVNAANSLVGTTANDGIGGGGVHALANGNYIVLSPGWFNSSSVRVGATTIGSGTGGTVGAISAANSLVGSSALDNIGSAGVTALSDGSVLIRAPYWDNGGIANVGAVIWSEGSPALLNTDPVLASIGSQTVDEGALLTFDADATDSDLPAQTLTYSITGAPVGATFNTATGEFSWTPGEADGGQVYNVTVTVNDDFTPAGSDSEAFTITVNETNNAPVLATIGNQFIGEGETLIFDADATDSDLPAQTLTYSITGAPAGATFNTMTGEFSWTAAEGDNGQIFNVTVTVTDNFAPAGSASEEFTITVTDANNNPILANIGDQIVDEGALLTFDADATDSDLPAQTLTYSITGAPVGATFNTATGEFSWTPGEADGGQVFNVTVTVTDSFTPAGSDSEDFTITVNEVNTAPVLATIGSRSGYLGETLSFDVDATDSDLPAQTLTFSLEAGAPAGATIDPTTGQFSWVLDASVIPGDYILTVTVTDNGVPNLSDSEAITISIGEVNLLANYGFETQGASKKRAEGWTPVLTKNGDRRVCNTDTQTVAAEGECAYRFKFQGVSTTVRSVQRKIDSSSLVKGDVIELRGKVSTKNLTPGARLILKAVYTNGKKTVAKIPLTPGTRAYEQVVTQLTLKKRVKKVVVAIQARTSRGVFYVDDLAVVKLSPEFLPLPSAALPDFR